MRYPTKHDPFTKELGCLLTIIVIVGSLGAFICPLLLETGAISKPESITPEGDMDAVAVLLLAGLVVATIVCMLFCRMVYRAARGWW